MSNELSKITLENVKQLSKVKADDVRKEIADKIEGGFLSALEVNMFFKFLEKMYEGDANKKNGLKDLIKDNAETEFDFNKNGTSLSKGNFVIEKAESGVTYDYSNDAEWLRLKEVCNEADKNRKEREELLKKIQPNKPLEIVDTDSGEVVKTFAPLRKSSTVLKYSLK